MRKMNVIRSLLTAFLCLSSWTVFAQYKVLGESFESGEIPSDWIQESSVSSAPQWIAGMGNSVSDDEAYDGTYRIALRGQEGSTKLILPMTDFKTSITMPFLRFAWRVKMLNNEVDTLRVYYRTPENMEWIHLDGAEYCRQNTAWEYVELSLAGVSGSMVQVAFEGKSADGGGVYLDDISIGNQWECAAAPSNLLAANVMPNSVSLEWKGTNYQGVRYYVAIDMEDHPDENMDEVEVWRRDTITEDTWLDVSGLSANTDYYFWVKQDCRWNDVSAWSTVKAFKTACEAQPVPYYEDFEVEETMPDCWIQYKERGSNPTVQKNSSTNPAYAGERCLYFYGLANYGMSYAALPAFSADNVQDLMLSFMGCSAYDTYIEIGVLDDPNDPSTYQMVKRFATVGDKQYRQYRVSFRGYEGTGKYIAITNQVGAQPGGFVIDDVHVDLLPACPPLFLPDVSAVTASSALFAWESIGTETSWNVKLSTTPLTDMTASADIMNTTVPKTSISFDKLQPNTTYYVYVQPDCGGEWIEAEFTTKAAITQLPYTDNFDIYGAGTSYKEEYVPTGWITGCRQTTTTTYIPYCYGKQGSYTQGYASDHTDNPDNPNHASLYFNATTRYYTGYAIMPQVLAVDNLQDLMLQFYAKQSSSAMLMVGVMDSPDDWASLHVVDTIDLTTQWELQTVYFDAYEGTGRYIVFVSNLDIKPASSCKVYVDDMVLAKAPSCRVPLHPRLVQLTSTAATVTWEQYNKEAEWLLQVATDPNMLEEVQEVVVHDNPYAIDKLQPYTDYYVRVAAVCGINDTTDWSKTLSFRTYGQIMHLPYVNDFDTVAGSTSTTSSVETYAVSYWYPWTCFSFNGSVKVSDNAFLYGSTSYKATNDHTNNPDTKGYNSVRLKASKTTGGACMASPEILAVDALNTLMVNFWAYTTTAGQMITVGMAEDASDTSTYTPIRTITIEEAKKWTECTVFLNEYTGNGKHIYLLSSNPGKDNTVYVDDLVIEVISDCPKVGDVEIPEETLEDTQAVITWNKATSAMWNVKVVEYAPDVEPETAVAVFEASGITENTVQATGLQGNRRYMAYVQTVDNARGCVGVWSSGMDFRTPCAVDGETLPFFMDFEGQGKDIVPACWNAGNTYSSSLIPEISSPSSSSYPAREGSEYLLYFSSGSKGQGYAWAITPKLDIDDIRKIQVNFIGAYKSPHTLQVGIVKNPNSMADFVLVGECTIAQLVSWDNRFQVLFNQVDAAYKDYKYVAFRALNTGEAEKSSSATQNYFAMDDLLISEIPECVTVYDITASSITETSARLTWKGVDERAWDIRIFDYEPDVADIEAGTDAVIKLDNIETKPYLAEKLPEGTDLHVYIRSVKPDKGCKGEWGHSVFRTLCAARELPYYEDFENYRFTSSEKQAAKLEPGDFPPCLVTIGSNEQKAYLYGLGAGLFTFKASGTTALAIETAKGKTNYVAFPAMDIDVISRLEVAFEAWKTVAAGGVIRVGAMYDPYDPTSYELIWEDSIPDVRIPYNYIVPLNTYRGNAKYIVLSAPSSSTSSNGVHFDWVKIDTLHNCHKPLAVQVEGVHDDSCTVNLHVIDGDRWHLRVFPYSETVQPDDPNPLLDTVVDNTVSVIGKLPYDKHLSLFAASICGTDTTEWSDAVKFKSACAESVGLPYSEDFANYEEDERTCWISANTNQKQDSTATVSWVQDAYPVRKAALYFGRSCKMMMPLFEGVDDLSQCQLYFSMVPATNVCTFKVSVYDEATGVATEVGQAQQKNAVYDERITEFHFSLADMAGKGERILFEALDGYAYLTDVRVEQSTCAMPVNVRLTDAVDDGLTVTWQATGSAGKWEIQYGNTGFAIGEGITLTTEETSYLLKGLAPNTAYDVYVRAVADEQAGVYSNWTAVRTLSTTPVLAKAPYHCDFEDMEENGRWMNTHYQTDTKRYPNRWYIGKLLNHGGEHSAYISADGGLSHSFKSENSDEDDLYRHIYLEAGRYKIAFDWQNAGEMTDYASLEARLYIPNVSPHQGYWLQDNGVNATSSNDCYTVLPVAGYDGTQLGEGLAQPTWRRDSTIVTIDKAGVYVLMFRFKNGANRAGKEMTPAAVDNVTVDYIPCIIPLSPAVKGISDTCATFSWQGSSMPEMNVWHLKVHDAPIRYADLETQETWLDTIVKGEPQVVIDSLHSNTTYYWAVRMDCEADTWTNVQSFHTLCDPMGLPYIETFESYVGGYDPDKGATRPECWQYSHSLGISGIFVGSGKNQSLHLGSGTYVVLPLLDAPINELEMRFDYSSSSSISGRKLLVGVVSDPFDITTFEEVSYCVLSGGGSANIQEHEMNFFNYQGNGRYITIKALDNAFEIDSIQVRTMPSCARVIGIEAGDITRNSVQLQWKGKDEQKWNVKIADTKLDNPNQTDGVVIDTVVTDNPSVFEGLLPFTDYYAYIQAVCSETEKGDWSKPYMFRTACGTYETPFEEDFSRFANLKDYYNRYAVEDLSCWTMRYAELDEVFAGITRPGVLPVRDDRYPDTQYSKWSIQAFVSMGLVDKNKGLVGMYSYQPSEVMQGIAYKERKVADWFISPELFVSGENVRLTFEMGVNDKKNFRTTDRLAILVSTDAGQTWTKEHAWIWSGDSQADRKLSDLPDTLTHFMFDMSQYEGMTIKLAFYIERLSGTSNAYLIIDNIALRCSEEYVLNDAICKNTDYNRNGFYLPYDLVVRDTVLTRVSRLGKCDSLVTLNLHVSQPVFTPLEATVCQGQGYTEYNFDIAPQTAPGTFEFRQYLKETGGCDSVVTLKLNVVQPVQTPLEATVCQGEGYTGYNFDIAPQPVPGTFEFTQSLTGMDNCDSLVVLNLTVAPTFQTEDEVRIKVTDLPYTYNDTTFLQGTVSGEFPLHYSTVYDCDSLVTLVLTVERGDGLLETTFSPLALHPNPVKAGSPVTVDAGTLDGYGECRFELFNSIGAKLHEEILHGTSSWTFRAPDVKGMYVVRLSAGGKTCVGKLMVE